MKQTIECQRSMYLAQGRFSNERWYPHVHQDVIAVVHEGDKWLAHGPGGLCCGGASAGEALEAARALACDNGYRKVHREALRLAKEIAARLNRKLTRAEFKAWQATQAFSLVYAPLAGHPMSEPTADDFIVMNDLIEKALIDGREPRLSHPSRAR